jgi:uroporphyrin-III C-methyltransferase
MADCTISLLAALNCKDAVHLIIGSNPLAAARCTQSLAAGATPLVIAPATVDEIHYGLQKHFDSGVKWINRKFQDEDLITLGREEIDGVVDAVFVTSGPRDPQRE